MAGLHFAVSAALLLLGAANANGMKRRMDGTGIVDGNVSYIEKMPYMVSLHDSGNFFCGGSILDPCHVLTSAKCLVGKDPKALTIRVGTPYFNESGYELKTRSFVIHPKFSVASPEGLDYNVAVIHTQVSMEFSKAVQPIPLADQEPDLGEPLIIAGWGEVEEGRGFQHQIHFAAVHTEERGECARIYDEWFEVNDRMICTHERNKGACRGDSGGPAVYDNHVVGVISHKVGCGMYPDIYTNVANPHIRKFIRAHAYGVCD